MSFRVAFLSAIFVSSLFCAQLAQETVDAIKKNELDYFKDKNIKELASSTNQNGKSALMLSIWEGKPKIVELFVKSGVNLDQADNSGKTALMIAVWRESFEIVQLLVANGADINLKNKEGLKALDIATLSGNGEIIDFLERQEKK